MAGLNYTTKSVPINYKRLNGGLNSTSGPLGLQDTESSDLQNIDLDKFGSVLKRSGYIKLNDTAIAGSPSITGLYWFELSDGQRFFIGVAGTKVFKMEDIDGTWDDITGALTITTNFLIDFDTFLDTVMMTNGQNPPFQWTGTGVATTMAVPLGLSRAKYVKQFSAFTFLANVRVTGIDHHSRLYWSDINSISLWNSADFNEVARNDGQNITGLKVLGNRLVIYKDRSIHVATFTGDADIPFVFEKTNSNVGAISHHSIQEVDNGHVFLSYDGLYYFDGFNSYKISDRLNTTFLSLNRLALQKCVSMYQKDKNKYWLAVPLSASGSNNRVITWDSFLNAFSIYNGINASSMGIVYQNGISEIPFFGDYSGFAYQNDVGNNDNPLGVSTAISAYFYTKWLDYDDLVDQKATPHVYIYYRCTESILTFAYSFDFEEVDTYQQLFSMSCSGSVYGVGIYGTATYSGTGGRSIRRDLVGRGRVLRIKFANANIDETFRIEGFGAFPYLETNV